jgi:putative ABC transport system permease protein
MIGDYFKLALGGITKRKLRSWLTMLGIFVGIMAVVALISLGEGLQDTINEEFKQVGSNRISILPGGGGAETALFGAGGLASAVLTDEDLTTVKNVRGVLYATGASMKTVDVSFQNEKKPLMLTCLRTDEDSLKLFEGFPFFAVERGKMLQKGDKYRAVAGWGLTEDAFDKKVKPNDKITVQGVEFTVIGIFKKAGNPVQDYKVAITKETCEEMFNITSITTITVVVKEGYNNTEVAETIKEKLRRKHGVKEGEEDFTVVTPEEIMRVFLSILDMVQFVLTGIAAISLLVGAIGIMNTMYTSILERTREIGIMKAVGGKNSDVLAIFMIEAGIIGTIGGVIGTVLGLAIAKMVEVVAVNSGFDLLKMKASPAIIVGAIAFSFIMGSLSGVFPAMRAARMKPVEALKQ